jgi:elongation factor P hydroxylase
MSLSPADLERAFGECFLTNDRTVLVGGGVEPVYLPSDDPSSRPHRVIYREDYFARALHEVAHWCLAGAERRKREDYGYWYSPDGRNQDEQSAFESVEARPQALERIFSEACEFPFHLSADNLTLGVESSRRFEDQVDAERMRLLVKGLPRRAAIYRSVLERLTRTGKDLSLLRPAGLRDCRP